MEWWSLWWVWLCAALALGILEVLVPSYIFLGIAVGAAIMAGVVVVAPGLGIAFLMAIFGALSLVSWLVLRRVFRSPDDQTRVIHEDVNK
ncbi:MAG: hypothetical protein AAFW87_10160 [Pseudomonadota bacterium]